MNAIDRLVSWFSPRAGVRRAAARAALRHYEGAASGRRTAGWSRANGDQNVLAARAGRDLRIHARDLVRNNGYGWRAQRIVANNTVGWGLVPRAEPAAVALWKAWAGSVECDVRGRMDFAAIQHAVMRALVTDGEVLIVRRPVSSEFRGALPMQLQVLEIDHLDSTKDGTIGVAGGPLIQGVELDASGRRAAYWILPEHPGSAQSTGAPSIRVSARDVLHVFEAERPNAERGISWLARAIVPMKDLDDLDDADLMRQKIAACFAAFVTDTDGSAPPMGTASADGLTDTLEPGMILNLPAGKEVTFGTPPGAVPDALAQRTVRKIAAGIGVTYEDLANDYSQVNFSSARMGRIVHQAHVRYWQWMILIPQLCDGVWRWAMEAAQLTGALLRFVPAEWTAPPLPMIEPDKEGLAYQRLIRVGTMTPSDMVREQGGDPAAHWASYAADLTELDRLGIKLDADVRAVSQAGLTQARVGMNTSPPQEPPP